MKKSLLHWHAVDPGTGADFRAITSDGSKFVAVGDVVATSQDGATWKIGPPNGTRLSSVAWGAGVFVATGCLTSPKNTFAILTSIDGCSWTPQQVPINIGCTYESLYPVCFGNGRFVIGGFIIDRGGPVLNYFESVDGVSWQIREIPGWPNMQGPVLVASDGQVIAIATYGMLEVPTGPPVQGTYGSSNQFTPTALGVGKGMILLGGWFTGPSDNGIWTTTSNGVSWDRRATTSSAVRQIALLGDTFVAVGDDGLILVSDDGIAWTTAASGTHVNLFGVTANAGNAVIAGERGMILVSDNLDARYLTVHFGGNGRGIVFSTPPGLLAEKDVDVGFPRGTVVFLSARPEPRYSVRDRRWSEFVGWSGDAHGTAEDCSVTMSLDRQVTAKFKAVVI